MIERFQGPEGERRLVDALRLQQAIANDEAIARELAVVAELLEFKAGEPLMTQDGSDSDIYFILVGSTSIHVNGRWKAQRDQNSHVGEMVLIEMNARRSATVTALQETVVAKVSETNFKPIADRHPRVWQRLAAEIGRRLRERGSRETPPNETPILFIGSSSERLDEARAIQNNLAHDSIVVRLWTDGVFRASRTTIENLVDFAKKTDFAVLLFSPDDVVTNAARGVNAAAPRDNVVFELGLFLGTLGRERTIVVNKRREDIKIPTDLLGLTPLEYADGSPSDLDARMAPVSNQLRSIVRQLGPK